MLEFNEAIKDIIAHYNRDEKTFKNYQDYLVATNTIMDIHQLTYRIFCMTPEVILENTPLSWIIGAYIAVKAYYYDTKPSKYSTSYDMKTFVLEEIERYVQEQFKVDIKQVWDKVMTITSEKWLEMKKRLGWNW